MDDRSTHSVFTLPSAMTIDSIEALCAQLKQLECTPPRLTLDAASTEIITTPGVQLLLALAKTLATRGIDLAVTGPRPSFTRTFDQLGLSAQFTQWEVTND